MQKFINNIYLIWFIPEEFKYFWAEYRSFFSETSLYFLVAFCLSLATALNSSSFNEIGIVTFLFFLHLPFMYFFPKLLAYFLDHKAREMGAEGDIRILLSFCKYSLVIFMLSCPFVIFVKSFEYNSSGVFLLFISFLSLLYFFNVARGLSLLYGLERSLAVKLVLSSVLSLLVLPFFFFIYYIVSLFSILL
jgi:hypothetical protein